MDFISLQPPQSKKTNMCVMIIIHTLKKMTPFGLSPVRTLPKCCASILKRNICKVWHRGTNSWKVAQLSNTGLSLVLPLKDWSFLDYLPPCLLFIDWLHWICQSCPRMNPTLMHISMIMQRVKNFMSIDCLDCIIQYLQVHQNCMNDKKLNI